MSFNDLERGNRSSGTASPAADPEFTRLKDTVSLQVFKIQSNVTGIQKLVDKLGGAGDQENMRSKLHNLTEATREMVKKSTADVKALAAYPAEGPQKAISAKLSREFAAALQNFQRVQRLSAERQRGTLEPARRAHAVAEVVAEEERERGSVELEPVQQQLQVQQQVTAPQVTQHELEFQEQLIAERENEIREIESGIHELNDIFRDIGAIVEQQGGLVDNIESNIISVSGNTREAAEELTTAHEYQRKAGRRMACLLMILVVVICVVILAVSSQVSTKADIQILA